MKTKIAAAGALMVTTLAAWTSGAFAAVADGSPEDVSGDNPSEALTYITDYALENAPVVIGIIGAIFLLAFTFMLIKRGFARGAQSMSV